MLEHETGLAGLVDEPVSLARHRGHGRLARGGRIDFVADLDQLRDAINKSAPRTEVWHLVLLGFLTLLIGEVLLTRRMVRGGYQQETPSS